MSTSGTYAFGNIQADDIIREAFERCGIVSDLLDGLKIQSALSSLNFMLSQWVNRGLNLWTIEKDMVQMNAGQSTYALPASTVDILELTAAQVNRLNLDGGVPLSNSGVAANAFDGNPATACTQTAPNGFIAWNYGYAQSISYVGVQSNATASYTLSIQYSYDGLSWVDGNQAVTFVYPIGQAIWFVVPAPANASFWRILETGGATLNIQELYFSVPSVSRLMTRISREEYIAIANKSQQATASSYYVDRTRNPVLNLWPTPDSTYPFMIYNRARQVQDIGTLLNNVDAPQRFYEAIVSGLAASLAVKFAMDRYPILMDLAERSYSYAAREDTEKVPLRIQPNFISYT